jgi:hypothetical protein
MLIGEEGDVRFSSLFSEDEQAMRTRGRRDGERVAGLKCDLYQS